MSSLRCKLTRLLANCCVTFLVFCYLIFFFVSCIWYNQRILVYPHGFAFLILRQDRVLRPRVPYALAILVTRDKLRLQCLVIPHSPSTSFRGTAILFHGNAMSHGDMAVYYTMLSHQGFTVFCAQYRGYGGSEGTPSESGLRLDAQAALDYVTSHPNLSKSPIVLYGHGLGGAVAIDLASRNADKISALIIQNTYSSIPSLVRKFMGRFPSLLTTEKWYSAPKIAEMPASLPILMMSGLRDIYIPTSEMLILWEAAKTRPKKKTTWFGSVFRQKEKDEGENLLVTQPEKDVFLTFRHGSHYDLSLQPEYWTAVTKFLDSVVVPDLSIPSSES